MFIIRFVYFIKLLTFNFKKNFYMTIIISVKTLYILLKFDSHFTLKNIYIFYIIFFLKI